MSQYKKYSLDDASMHCCVDRVPSTGLDWCFSWQFFISKYLAYLPEIKNGECLNLKQIIQC